MSDSIDQGSNAEPTPSDSGANPYAPQESEPKKGIERGPLVFGRFRRTIVLYPFVFYLLATMIGGYVEGLRIDELKGELGDHGENRLKEDVDIKQLERARDPNEKFLFGLLPLNRSSYPYTYTATIGVTTVMMLIAFPGYFRAPFKLSFLSVIIGAVGVVVWVGLSWIDSNTFDLGSHFASTRPAFNPFVELKDDGAWMWQFLAIRFFGLVLVVPFIEEFFLRGFLMRYCEDPDWDEIPLGVASSWVWVVPTVYGIVAHPAEPLSAIVWFSMVTWLYKKTGSIWDCVMAHLVTNLLLGIYIVNFDAWHLW